MYFGQEVVATQKSQLMQNQICLMNELFSLDDNMIVIPPINETANFLTSNLIEALSPKACTTGKDGKCLRFHSRGRSINYDHPKGLDIIFMIDSSSSVEAKNFPLALEFANHIIEQFGVDYG